MEIISCKLHTKANRWRYVLYFLLLWCQLCGFIELQQTLHSCLSVPDSIEDGATTEEPDSTEDEEEEEEEPTPVDNEEGRDATSEEREEDEDEVPQRQSPLSNHYIQVTQLNTEDGELGHNKIVYNLEKYLDNSNCFIFAYFCSDPASFTLTAVPQPNSYLPKEVPRIPEGPSPVLLRGPFSNTVSLSHIGPLHPPLPPSSIIEELHRALATKLRQDR